MNQKIVTKNPQKFKNMYTYQKKEGIKSLQRKSNVSKTFYVI